MKTFREFILEAEIKWNTGSLKGSGKSPSDTAKQKQAQLNRTAREKPSPEVFGRVSRMKGGISGATALARDTDAKPETTATRMQRTGRVSPKTKTSGYASQPRDTRGRVGSLENIPSSAGEGENTSTGGRFGDRRSGRSGGVSGQSRNNATARNMGHLGTRS